MSQLAKVLSTLALRCFIQMAPAAPLLGLCANPSAQAW